MLLYGQWYQPSCVSNWRGEYCQAHLHLDFVGLDAFVQRAHVVLWQVTAIIDAPVVAQEVLQVPHPSRVPLSCLKAQGVMQAWMRGHKPHIFSSHRGGAYGRAR